MNTDYTSGDVSPLALAMDAIMAPGRSAGFRRRMRAWLLRRRYARIHGRAYETLLESYLAATDNVDTASTRAGTVVGHK